MRSLFLLLLTVGLCLAQDSGEGSGEGSGAGSGSGSGNGSQESHEGSGTRIIGDDPCNPQLDLIFLLDTSGSIEQVYKEHARWTVELADALPVDKDAVRIATIQYAGFPLTEFALGTYTTGRDVVEHLKQISFQSGVTRTGYALRKADSELFRDDRGARRNAKKAIVLFTDGLSIDDPIKPAEVLRDEKNVSIYVVSVSADGFVPEMQRIAGNKERTFGSSELERLKATLVADVEESRVCEREGLQRVIPIVNGDNEIEPKKESLPIEVAAAAAPNTGSAEVIPLEKIQPLGTARPAIIFTAVTAAPIQVQKEAKVTKVEFTFPTLATASLSTLPPLPTTTREAANPQSVEAVGTIAPFPPQTVATATTDAVSPVKVKRIRRIYRRRSTTPSPSSVGSEEPDEPHAEPSPKKVVKVVKVFRTSTIAAAESSSTTLSPLPTAPASTRAIFTRRTLAPAPPAPPVAEQSLDVLAEQIEQQADRPLSRSFTTTRQYSTRVFSTRPPARAFAVRNSDGTLGKGCPKDILFIVDSSGSVQSIYDQQKEYLLSVLSEIDVAEQDHRVALIQFAGAKLQKTEWSFDRFNDKNDLMRAFDNVRHFTGTTYIGAALELARQLLDKRRPGVPAIVVLVSDGFSQDDAIEPAGEILKQRNLELYATSITEQANPDYLTQITQDPNNVFIGEDKTRLRQLLVSRFTCAA